MALGKDYVGQECVLARALELLGERWTLLIVRDAFYGVQRYNDFLVHLGIPRAVLAERLQVLTHGGVLEKRRYQESPPREEYVLTATGRELWPTIHTLSRWGARHHSAGMESTRTFAHATCGTRLDDIGLCPKCGGLVQPEDVEMRTTVSGAPKPLDRVSAALRATRRLLEPISA